MRKCKECEFFRVVEKPDGVNWGRAECSKHDLEVDFRNERKINRLTCVEDAPTERVTAIWGQDYDGREDKIYRCPVCPNCKTPFGKDTLGVERCYSCGRIVDVLDPEMIEWLKVRREIKKELQDCWKCGGKECDEVILMRNPVTLKWQACGGHCKNCGMNWIV